MRKIRRYEVARAAAETLFDDGAGVSPAELDALLADLDDFLRHAGWRTTLGVRFGACGAVQLAPFLQGRFRPFTWLKPAERADVLLGLERSGSLGKAWAGLKVLLAMLWFDGPAGARWLPDPTRKTVILEEPVDPDATTLGPEGALPSVNAKRPEGALR